MKTINAVPAGILLSFLIAYSACAALCEQTYSGLPSTGSSDLGGGNLQIGWNGGTSDINFTFNRGSRSGDLNMIVLYLDTIPNAGFQNTSSFTDYNNLRTAAISGYDGSHRSVARFAPGFGADFAVAFNSYAWELYQLSTGDHTQLRSYSFGSGGFRFSLMPSDLQMTGNGGLRFQSTCLNTSYGAFYGRTAESYENMNWSSAWGDVTFNNFNVFPVPEMTSMALPLFGGLVLAGGVVSRLRKSRTARA